MGTFILVLNLFIIFLCAVCVFAVVAPQRTVDWTLEKTKGTLRFYGFEGEIRSTARSKQIIRFGHLIVLVMYVGLMYIINSVL